MYRSQYFIFTEKPDTFGVRRMNFFREFNVCFYAASKEFELTQK